MLVLITYDICTSTSGGERRLRTVAKLCERKGRRVQNSVFECLLDAAQLRAFQKELMEMIDPEIDSLRFYNLGNHYENRVERRGKCAVECYEEPLVF